MRPIGFPYQHLCRAMPLLFLNLLKRPIALSLCLLMLAGCSGSESGKNSRAGWITVGTKEKPRTLDPADAYEISALGIVANMGERLYAYNPGSTKLIPQLATELPKISADGLTYTIPIRKGVVFHDGTPFDAEAMAFSLRRFIANGGGPSFLLSDRVDYLRPDPDPKSKNPPQVNPDGLKATGKYELTIKLKKPFAAFPSLLAFTGACAVSPKAYADFTVQAGAKADKEKSWKKKGAFVGTGPYRMIEGGSDDRIELEVFDRYWGDKPANKGVTVQIYLGSASNLYNSFKTGAVDVAYLSLEPDQIRSLQDSQKAKGWKVTEVEGNGTSYIMLNATQKPLDNPLVRQAIAAMVDRPLLNQRVLYDQGKSLYSMIPSSFSESRADFRAAYSSSDGGADLQKAKSLLQQAGFTAQKPAIIQIWYASSSSSKKMIANFLRAYAKSKMEGLIVFEPNTAEKTAFNAMSKSRAFPIIIQDWYPDFIDVDTYIQPFLECTKLIQPTEKEPEPPIGCQEGGSAEQGSFYYNDTMNQLISKQGQAKNPAERLPLVIDIQKQVANDVPLIPLWQTKDFIFSRPGVSGAYTDPLQNLQYSSIQKTSK
jgi:peptide/nickel transport system substrate-binding protein